MKKNYILSLVLFFLFFCGFSQITSFPHTTTFESSSDISTTASDVNSKWVTRTDGAWVASELLWERNSGSTPSTGTGPTAAQAGSYYVFVETSGSTGNSSEGEVDGDDAELSCNYDFSGKTEASISFNYHNWGEGASTPNAGSAQMALYVYNVTDSQWSSALWTNDAGLNSGSNTWYSQTVDLSAYDGKSVQIWFTLNSRGWASDGALDNIEVTAYTPNGITDYYVDDSGSNSNNGLTSGAPFATLAKALSVSDDGTGVTINVGAGTYTEEDLTISRSNITISGAGSSQTIFDGDLNGRFATISANNTTIQNLQIKEYGVASSCTTNGSCGGGAIIVGTSKTGFVVNNAIFDGNITNGTSGDGGAIEFYTGSTSTINSTIFRNNKAGSTASYQVGRNGGATKGNGSCTVTFNNCLFHENVARGYSGAHTNWMNDGGSSTFNNCTIEGNTQYDTSNYGAVSALYGTVNMRNSIIRNTTDGSAGSGSARDIYFVTGINLNYGVQGSATLSGTNSTSNPQFTDIANDDYTLQSGSPAIDVASSTYAPSDDMNDLTKPQGQADDLGAYEHANTWDGSSSTAWALAANWSENIVPVSGRSPVIVNVTNDPDITTDVSLEDITIKSGAILDINSTGSLTLTDDFTNSSGTVNLNSASNVFPSIKVAGDASGNIIYNRYVNAVGSGEWDLIGSPVDGLSISSFASTNGSPLATGGGAGSNQYAIGYYDNATDNWTNYTTSTIGAAGNFDIGKGYQMGTDSGATLAFTGTIPTTDQTQSIIDNDAANSGTGRRWSLIANPFPSFINANYPAHSTNNFIDVNTTKLHDTYEAVYGYDADGSGYTVYNNSSSATYIAPGQGFMVASDNTSSDNVSFTEAMQTVSGTDDFIAGDIVEDSFELILKLYEGDTEIDYTRFYFKDGLNLSLDPGYDAGHFNQQASLMSRLLEEDQGHGLVINAMGLENVNDVVVPLVINREAGTDFRISIDTFGIYAGTNVYLEDNEQGTMTLLNEQDFELTPESTLSEVGRFYLHLTESTFSIDDQVETNLLNVFKADYNNFITVEGLAMQLGVTNLKLYSILGTEVLSTSLNNNTNTQTISTERLATGVYVIKLQSGNTLLTKKLIIK